METGAEAAEGGGEKEKMTVNWVRWGMFYCVCVRGGGLIIASFGKYQYVHHQVLFAIRNVRC